MKPIIIVGAGGHGRVCADTARAMGRVVAGFCDAKFEVGERINGLPVLAPSPIEVKAGYSPSEFTLFIAIGDNDVRRDLFHAGQCAGFELTSLAHPSAVIAPSVVIGAGSVLMPGSIVNANTRIGEFCILNTACSIDHDNVLDDGVQISPGVRSAGTVSYGELAFVGTGASIVPGVRIGARAVVGAGAVVITDVEDGTCVAGAPAKVIMRTRR